LTTFRASEDGIATMGKPEVDPVLARVERNGLGPPGVSQGHELGEESGVAHEQRTRRQRPAGMRIETTLILRRKQREGKQKLRAPASR
jgi:hypothetical protein